MVTQTEIRRNLIAYLTNSMSLADFEDWIVSHSWDMHSDSDQDSIDLVDDIELALSDFSDRHSDVAKLRLRLFDLVKHVVATYVEPNLSVPKHRSANSAAPKVWGPAAA
jgi:hypothetical protein